MKNTQASFSLPTLEKGVRAGDQKAKGMLYLYLKQECYPNVERYLVNRGAGKEDAEDLFQDAVLVLFRAIEDEKFRLSMVALQGYTRQFGAYLMSVVKNLWKKELRWRARKPIKLNEQPLQILIKEMPAGVLAETFSRLGKDCRQLLAYYFKDQLSPRMIASRTEQKTDELKKQLHSCINSLLQDIGQVLGANDSDQLSELLTKGLNDLEERCRTILTKFYYEKKRMQTISEELGYANAHVVIEQKNRCMKRLNAAIANRILNHKEA